MQRAGWFSLGYSLAVSSYPFSRFINQLADTGSWAAMACADSIRYCFRSNTMSFVSLSQGKTRQQLRLELEGSGPDIDYLKTDMLSANALVFQMLKNQAAGEKP